MSDAPAVQRVYSGESVRFTHGDGYRMTVEDAHRRITEALTLAQEIPRPRWDFSLLVADDVVGVIALRVREPGMGTVSYILRQDAWGQGHATEAVRRVAAFAFTHTDLECLEAKHHPANPASGRVLAKAGFTCVGTSDLHAEGGVVVPYPAYELRRYGPSHRPSRLRQQAGQRPPPHRLPQDQTRTDRHCG
ncbi:GNAT family N-acetyltransferase [Streptomyces sp. LaBMicrA B280]|uniref:GNAT family N-acetyltransferase n=1 Tax=Streptomyces sp. LaBMicrA B280 TaxID=3391001 RepID=UPI003BA7A421